MSIEELRKKVRSYWNANQSHKLGAGAARRRKVKSKSEKHKYIAAEFKHHTLHSGSGDIVTNPKQMVAIMYSEDKK